MVSIHTPTWGATQADAEEQEAERVSIHAPTWGRDFTSLMPSTPLLWFQSTRPQGARPHRSAIQIEAFHVSIHAPARGATRQAPAAGGLLVVVSIHTPARGATIIAKQPRRYHVVSIHAPARGATGGEVDSSHPQRVSIHAPTRGATPTYRTASGALLCFNPRARMGATRIISKCSSRVLFQSTRPRGARRVAGGCSTCIRAHCRSH